MQIGNKGTWSTAAVAVTAPPAVEPHAGDLLFGENFDNYVILDTSFKFSWAAVDLGAGGWQNTSNDTELMVDGYAGHLEATSGDAMLDTQATAGAIDISHQFNDPTGGKVQLSFDISLEDFTDSGNGTTSLDAAFQFKIGDSVETITVQDILDQTGGHWNEMAHFDILMDTGAAGDYTLRMTDITPVEQASNFGFALDTVQVHDWIV